ncbi:FecR domain-containing protein [Herbaspirillum sp. meg3]|uniref:FecR domain-containing protein n=1 Tax=Herbaspirillum sp. meg3 TaxID=2025949 RepID=UPI0018DF3EA5|nr:FecR domain-containing protein [Herbaspirillum sp. meg3]
MANDSLAEGDDVVMAAIDWMVKLQSGAATEQEREACRRWRAEEARHEQAWQRLQSLSDRIATLPRALAHGSIGAGDTRHRHNRRFALKTLCVAMGVGVLVAGGSDVVPWSALMAEYSTEAGEHRRVVLADGTAVELNTATAIDTAFDEQRRVVRLHRGEVLISTAKENDRGYRPFVVHTRLGQARALGTRFQVRDSEAGMRIAVFEGAVEFQPAGISSGHRAVRIDAGHQGLFNGQGLIGDLSPANEDAVAWTDGFIVADRMPLGELVAELDRNMPGKLRCDPAIANLPISGVFPLDQPARILAAIGRTLPVQIDTFTAYWITLRPRDKT